MTPGLRISFLSLVILLGPLYGFAGRTGLLTKPTSGGVLVADGFDFLTEAAGFGPGCGSGLLTLLSLSTSV